MSCAFGFDVGSKLTGVAIGSLLTASARGLDVLPMREGDPDWSRLDRLRAEWLPDTLVVGLPLTLDGEEQAATRNARRFARQLQQRYGGLPVILIDERHSSQEAAQRFAAARAAGTRRRNHAALIDAEAAAVILERWLGGAESLPCDLAPP